MARLRSSGPSAVQVLSMSALDDIGRDICSMNLWPPQVHASVLLAWNKCICGSCRGVVEERIHRCGIYGAWPVVMGAVAVVRVREYSRASVGARGVAVHNLACICRGTRSHGTTSHARGLGGWGWGARPTTYFGAWSPLVVPSVPGAGLCA